jgi:deoxyribodipyrimidine photolyase-related protein
MGQYADGGLTTRRPYISSSAYILKMSDYKKEDWCETWDELFKKFLKDNKTKLKHTIYARK